MATFVHTGDIHLDTPFSANFSRKQMQLRRHEIMQTFRNIVLASKNKDFLFICGDLFDGRFVSMDTIAFVKRCFEEISDTQIFISAGNHDPFVPGSAYETTDWGENVHIFNTQWEYFDFPEKKARIHGISFGTSHEEESLLQELEIKPEWCNIMILHGDLVSTAGKSAYNPIYKDQIARSGMDYIALGHIHKRTELDRADGTYFAYCGIPEGRGFDEEGEKGYYVGETERGRTELNWIPSSCRVFRYLSLDISEVNDSVEVQEKIVRAMQESGGMNDMYKVILTGKVRNGMVDADALCDSLAEQAFYLDVINETKPKMLLEDVAKENTLRGTFVSTMMEKIQFLPDHEKEIGYLALELGLSAMERGQGQ